MKSKIRISKLRVRSEVNEEKSKESCQKVFSVKSDLLEKEEVYEKLVLRKITDEVHNIKITGKTKCGEEPRPQWHIE